MQAIEYSRDMSYFDRASATLIAHTPKCGSTSLFLRALQSQGMDPDLIMEQARCSSVDWDEGIWVAVPGLPDIWKNLPREDQRATLDPARVRMVAIVRSPRARLWSAWVSKVLAGGRYYDVFYGPGTTLHQAGLGSVQSVADLMEPFSQFVGALADGHRLLVDPHFIPQADLLGWTHAECEILPLSRANEVIGLIGRGGGRTAIRQANAGAPGIPLPPLPRSVDDEIAAIYARDDAAFGAAWAHDPPHGAAAGAPEQPLDADAFAMRIRLGRRLAAVERDGGPAIQDRREKARRFRIGRRAALVIRLQLRRTSARAGSHDAT